ncbi:MAG: DNA translocase FtsK 4TM domain-containing protein, partial [Betaproteobacteria bacterium]
MAVSAAKHKHWHEMIGLLLFATGLLIVISLMSYSATDPCFSVSGTGNAPKNTIGIIGAYLSDALLRLFGVAAYLIPLFLFGYAVFLALGREASHPYLKKIGGLVLFFSTAAFFGLRSETVPLFGEEIPAGGMLGGLISHLLVKGFSATGSYIITITAIIISLMLLTPFSLLKALAWFRGVYGRLSEQLDLLIMVYRGRREKAREAKQRPAAPKEPPKIVDTQRPQPSSPRNVKLEKPPKPVQASFEFMGGKDGKGAYQLPSPDLLDTLPPT